MKVHACMSSSELRAYIKLLFNAWKRFSIATKVREEIFRLLLRFLWIFYFYLKIECRQFELWQLQRLSKLFLTFLKLLQMPSKLKLLLSCIPLWRWNSSLQQLFNINLISESKATKSFLCARSTLKSFLMLSIFPPFNQFMYVNVYKFSSDWHELRKLWRGF